MKTSGNTSFLKVLFAVVAHWIAALTVGAAVMLFFVSVKNKELGVAGLWFAAAAALSMLVFDLEEIKGRVMGYEEEEDVQEKALNLNEISILFILCYLGVLALGLYLVYRGIFWGGIAVVLGNGIIGLKLLQRKTG